MDIIIARSGEIYKNSSILLPSLPILVLVIFGRQEGWSNSNNFLVIVLVILGSSKLW